MTNNEKLKLIDGDFIHEEAKEILMSIFSAKINFHQMKNFSSQERFGKDDETAVERIPALKHEIAKLNTILSAAKAQNKRLTIISEINISLSNEE